MKFTLINSAVRERACQAVMTANEGDVVEIRKPTRTNSQNALYWKRLDIIRMHIADSTGEVFTRDELHKYFKKLFLPVKVVEIGGVEKEIEASSHDKDTAIFAKFMDDIDHYCIEKMGLYLPVPGVEQ